MQGRWLVVSCLIWMGAASAAQRQIESIDAASFVGQSVSVCGNVAGFKKFSKGTFLNVGASYPRQHLTLLIWDSNEQGFKEKFGGLSSLTGKRVCASGVVEKYKNSLEMKISDPSLLTLAK
jgi:DNA/RNA endonuclease YhcR with UshA esterase domain